MGEQNQAPEGEEGRRIEDLEDAPGGVVEEEKEKAPEDDEGPGENPQDQQENNTSNISISTMDADLKHIITSVCGINNTQNAFKAVNNMGIHSVEDFAATPHDTTFQYDNAGVMTCVNANH